MLIRTKPMILNANEEEVTTEELPAEDNLIDDETGDTEGESEEVSEEQVDDEAEEDRDEISVNRADYDKLRREAAAAKRLREKGSKKDHQQDSQQVAPLDQELISRTFLAAQSGITDKEIQNEALRLADKFGMNIAEAMEDPDISLRVKNLQTQREAKRAIAKSTGGSAARTKDLSYYASYFKQHGDFPPGTPNNMIVKVMDTQ